MLAMRVGLTICIIVLAGIVVVAVSRRGRSNQELALPKTVSYNFHIRPILSDKCFKCHGPDGKQRQAGLRLDIADSAFAPLKETKGGFAIVPGKPEESELFKRVSSTDST
jgi:hypothetical protein